MDYINSLISGIIVFRLGKEYIYVRPFSAEDKTFADFFSQEQYDDALIDGIWTQKDAENHLISAGYLSQDHDIQLKQLDENIENMKVDYFNHFYNSTTREYIKKNILKQNERNQELYSKKYVLYDKTCEHLKRYSFLSYLLQRNSCFQNGKLASGTFSTQILYNKYIAIVNDLASQIRNVAKNEEWKTRWYSLKRSVFSNKKSSLTDQQISLISWSNYYDSVYQSMDKPSDDIIDDDIALDGWSIVQRRKRKEEDKKRNAEKMLPDKMRDAGEIFIPARTKKEAEDIMSLNDGEAVSKIKSLKKDLQEYGSIEESQLTSTRRELQMQAVQMAKDNRRR